MTYARKYNEQEIDIRLKNLKKILGDTTVEGALFIQKYLTDNEIDAKNMAYYNLKRLYSKIKGYNFGFVNNIEYEPKIHDDLSSDALSSIVWHNWYDTSASYIVTNSYTITNNTSNCYTYTRW